MEVQVYELTTLGIEGPDLRLLEEFVGSAIGVLTAIESKLYGERDEVLQILGWNAPRWDVGSEEEFMRCVRSAGKKERGRSG